MTIMDSNDDHDDDHNGHDGDDVDHNQGCPRGGFWQLHLPRNKPAWPSQVDIIIVIIIIIIVIITNIIILIIRRLTCPSRPGARSANASNC